MNAAAIDVLVVGAGPTGLALALQAHDHGARVRIVERRPEPFRPSRALAMHPRTLEVLRPFGVTDALFAAGDTTPTADFHLGSSPVRVSVDRFDLPDTPFPHLLLIRQSEVERVLGDALEARGVQVERGVEVVGVERADGHAVARLRQGSGLVEAPGRFLVGCDGPASAVRAAAGLGWRGRPYRQEVVLADVDLDGDLAAGVAHVVPARRGLVFLFALGEGAPWRLLATRPASGEEGDVPFGQPDVAVATGELQHLLDAAGLPVRITRHAWSARVRLQHGLAARYRSGPLFIAGDAAHAHSPAGAQGMNTGIGDATNLGWKLAFAARGGPPTAAVEPLLDSYEVERRPVARRVIALTHTLFWAEAGTDPAATFARRMAAMAGGPVVPWLVQRRRLVGLAVRPLSQLTVRYRRSPISVDGTPRGRGMPRPGERLANETVRTPDGVVALHDLLAGPGLHVLLQRHAAGLDRAAIPPDVAVHRILTWPGTGLVAVRPDGVVGFRCGVADAGQLRAWLRLLTPGLDAQSTSRPVPGRNG